MSALRPRGIRDIPIYSNLPEVEEGWITLVSSGESNPKAGKHAYVGEMVGMAVPRADVLGRRGGVYPSACQSNECFFVFNLRPRSQH